MNERMTPIERVRAAYARIEAVDRPDIWIHLRPMDDVLAEAAVADPSLPLAGTVVAVKDNIDVAGLPTTAAAPSYSYIPEVDATAVARLRAAGAVVIGKTNLDQFATGLVGTRSPYGAVRNAWDESRISGGSSSGSAVAVALGIADLGIGTDTAGSGRVPAALNGVVGFKATKGFVPTAGVVPACEGLDCVTAFAPTLLAAQQAIEVMAAAPLPGAHPSARPRVAVPLGSQVAELSPSWRVAFEASIAALSSSGAEVVEVDIEPLLAAARMLYESSFVADRYAAVGAHIEAHRDLIGSDLDPTVAQIVLGGARPTAAQYAADLIRLGELGVQGRAALAGCVALLTPTTTWHPTLVEVEADPIGANSRMGRFTNFANLLDFASVAVPVGFADGLPFGVMFTGESGTDGTLAALAGRLLDPPVDLFVVGAHLSGFALNSQLVSCGAVLVGEYATAAEYRLHALATTPAKPGLVHDGSTSIVGEVWRLPASGFGRFVAAVPAPMTIGTVTLADGRQVSGFLVESQAVAHAPDISAFGGWRAYRSDMAR